VDGWFAALFRGWVKEVRTKKSKACGAQRGICIVNKFSEFHGLLFSV
jgi:hypothetical protein